MMLRAELKQFQGNLGSNILKVWQGIGFAKQNKNLSKNSREKQQKNDLLNERYSTQ